MALYDLFLFAYGGQNYNVRYSDTTDQVHVYNDAYEEVAGPGNVEHENVGAQFLAAGKTFIGIASYPYAEEYIAPDPDPEPEPEPEYPADGTYLRSECNGYNLQQVLADGNGGERWGNVLEYNSSECGYVAPVYGCTDPEAENFDEAANTDDGSCVYAPKVYTEVKTVVVRPCTPGVYLRWINSLGGVEGWLFSGKVSHPFASEASGEYSLASGLKGATQKHGSTNMIIRASGLNFNQYQALCEVYTSRLVWLEKEGKVQELVYVVPGSVDPEPGKKSYELAVELSLTPPNS